MKNKRVLNAVILFIIFIGLILYNFYDKKNVEKAEKAKSEKGRIFSVKKENIKKVTIKLEAETIVLSKKEENKWFMEKPFYVPAEEEHISSIVSTLEEIRADRTLGSDPSNAKMYGFEKPEVFVTFQTDDNTTQGLVFGMMAPTKTTFYVKRADRPDILVTPSYNETPFKKSAAEFRDKSVISVDKEKLESIQIKWEQNDIILEKIKKDEWEIAKPIKEKADLVKINEIIDALNSSKITEFIDQPKALSTYSLDSPTSGTFVTLLIEGADKEKISKTELHIGRNDLAKNGYYAKLDTAKNVFIVPSDLIDKLHSSLNDYRSKNLFGFDEKKVSKIDVAFEDKNYSMSKSGNKWMWTAGAELRKVELIDTAVEDYIKRLRNSRFGLIAEEDPQDVSQYEFQYEFNKPSYHVKVFDDKNEIMAELVLGKREERDTAVGYYGKSSLFKWIVVVPEYEYEGLKIDSELFVKKGGLAEETVK